MSRFTDSSEPLITQEHLPPQHYSPGASCLTCDLWDTSKTTNPNRAMCAVDKEMTDRDWSCPQFTGWLWLTEREALLSIAIS